MGDNGLQDAGRELESRLGLVVQFAKAHEGEAEWIADARYAIDAVHAATQDILSDGAHKEAAIRFLSNLRKPSLDLIRGSRFLFESKYTKKEDFRETLTDGMYALYAGSPVYDWSLKGCSDIVTLLRTGSILFPILGKQTDDELGAQIYGALGPGFPERTTGAIERAREILYAAGVDTKKADNLLDSAEAMQKVRAKKRAAHGVLAPAKTRKKRRG